MNTKLYMLWTSGNVLVGAVEDDDTDYRTHEQIENPVRVYRPLVFIEQVALPQVKVGFAPFAASCYIPWIDVNWIMAVPLMAMEKAKQIIDMYERISMEMHAQATAGIVIANPIQTLGKP